MRDYPETESDIVIVIADIPVVDVGQTTVIRVTTNQTVTVSKLCALFLKSSLYFDFSQYCISSVRSKFQFWAETKTKHVVSLFLF